MRDKRTWIIYEINHDGERCDLVPWFCPSEVVGSQVSLALTSVPVFSVSFPFAFPFYCVTVGSHITRANFQIYDYELAPLHPRRPVFRGTGCTPLKPALHSLMSPDGVTLLNESLSIIIFSSS
jgi:hypothetical protein